LVFFAQFRKVPDGAAFTSERSIRSPKMAVYPLPWLNRKPLAVCKVEERSTHSATRLSWVTLARILENLFDYERY